MSQPINLTLPSDGNNWKINNVTNIIAPSGNILTISGYAPSSSLINAGANIDISGNLNIAGNFLLPISNLTTQPAVVGCLRYNPIVGIQYYNGTSWLNIKTSAISLSISAGLTSYVTITYADSNNNSVASAQNGGYTIYTFKWNSAITPGTTISGTLTISISSAITYLVVAGGGAGGGRAGGGGGAGGLLTGSTSLVANTAYSLQVGQGGVAGASGNGSVGGNGATSIFNAVTAAGGGGGGSVVSPGVGQAGGSGGGGSDGEGSSPAGGAGNNPATSPSQGNSGGFGQVTGGYAGGGGGGAGGVGGNAGGYPGPGATSGGAGGIGSAPANITAGALVYYAGGGGGGLAYSNFGPGGTGGNGGGGAGAAGPSTTAPGGTPASPIAGTNGLGGGGGGGGFGGESVPTNYGANGGSGVVILRIPSYA
jgi:hypothetical protein